MGRYKSQYENYYKSMEGSKIKGKTNGFFGKIIGIIIILGIFLFVRELNIESAGDVFNGALTLDMCKETALDLVDKTKKSITGEPTQKDIIRSSYVVPINSTYKDLPDEKDLGVIFEGGKNLEVKSCYSGVVSEVTKDYMIINHDNGIESFYGLISNVNVEVGQDVKCGEIIGECGDRGIVFKLIYMGIEKNPSELIDFSGLSKV